MLSNFHEQFIGILMIFLKVIFYDKIHHQIKTVDDIYLNNPNDAEIHDRDVSAPRMGRFLEQKSLINSYSNSMRNYHNEPINYDLSYFQRYHSEHNHAEVEAMNPLMMIEA